MYTLTYNTTVEMCEDPWEFSRCICVSLLNPHQTLNCDVYMEVLSRLKWRLNSCISIQLSLNVIFLMERKHKWRSVQFAYDNNMFCFFLFTGSIVICYIVLFIVMLSLCMLTVNVDFSDFLLLKLQRLLEIITYFTQ